MNKSEFVARLNDFFTKFDISPEDCYVSYGGAMLMMGLADSTGDIDLSVTRAVYDQFKMAGYPITPLPATGDMGEWELISVDECIDILPNENFNNYKAGCVVEGNVHYRDMTNTLIDYQTFNRDKDQHRIKQLSALLD